ncbi:UNVERIFIED_CONTAM: hypothetical protein RMT77_005743 [Armadillidium vulgare]
MPSYANMNCRSWPKDVGIIAIEVYFPSQFVCQKELEEHYDVEGKYTIGLGQTKMGFCSEAEDINSLCLTALTRLMESTKIGLRSSYMKHVYDFYKPDLSSEYPVVDGKLSIECYLAALDSCYQTYLRKSSENKFDSDSPSSLKDFDMFAFHTPFCKLVQKSFARLHFNDFLRCSSNMCSQLYPGLEKFRDKILNQTYFDKDVESAFITFSRDEFEMKTKPSLLLASHVGNMYTPSLYGGLASILATSTPESISGKRIGMFSYGSGLTATMFSIKISQDYGEASSLRTIVQAASSIPERLNLRTKISPKSFTDTLSAREVTHPKVPYTPIADVSCLFPGTWYLSHIDELHRRKYEFKPSESGTAFTSVVSKMSCVGNGGVVRTHGNGSNGEVSSI